MRPVLTTSEVAALEDEVIRGGTSVEVLRERAGAAVAAATAALAGGCYGRRALVVAGPGANGGDGVIAARRLRAAGMRVDVLRVGDGSWSAGAFADAAARADVVVDALLGIGARGAPRGEVADAIRAIGGAGIPVVAVDVPSGVDVDAAFVHDPAVVADATVTFGAPKPCLVLPPASRHAGALIVADVFRRPVPPTDLALADDADVAAAVPARAVDAHKRSTGVVGVVGGSLGMAGAVALAAAAAARAGAGLVRVAVPGEILDAVSSLVPEATAVALDGATAEGDHPLTDVDALVVGPGLGREPAIAQRIRAFVASSTVPVVIDADALLAFAGELEALRALPVESVLTPHAGEFARLAATDPDDLANDRLGHARAFAARTRRVVVLKGPATVIAHPSGRAVVDDLATSSLATAGSGDVLAGVIGAFIARGATPFDAAWAGVRVHARAGRLAGELGVVAGDVVAAIPDALAGLR